MPLSLSGAGSIGGLATGLNGVGKVVQISANNYTSPLSTTSQTYVDMGVTADITPTAATSRILVVFSGNVALTSTSNTALFNLVRNGTNIAQPSSGSVPSSFNVYSTDVGSRPVTWMYLDSPNSTSLLTYKMQWRLDASFTAYYLRHVSSADYNTVGTFLLAEIAL